MSVTALDQLPFRLPMTEFEYYSGWTDTQYFRPHGNMQ